LEEEDIYTIDGGWKVDIDAAEEVNHLTLSEAFP
jgi:hypothetical protein